MRHPLPRPSGHHLLRPFVVASFGVVFLVGCSCEPEAVGGADGSVPDGSLADGSVAADGAMDVAVGDSGARDSTILDVDDECEPPDMLLVLDRTMSMHRRPDGSRPPDTPEGHMSSKWYLAITAVEEFTLALDGTIRFGLELFPVDSGGCVTLTERITDTTATNVQCEAGEILVAPDVDTAAAINAAIDPETTLLCRSTPVGAGLVTAAGELARIRSDEREQFVVLITDGQDTCEGSDPVGEAQRLFADGAKTYVIGFDALEGTGIDLPALNNLACAGGTAPDFPAPCTEGADGAFSATNPDGAPLFLRAEGAEALVTALEATAGDVCCGCVI